ncbi:glycoside hydrolase family 2 TIM barrel-domain containing protein [Cohnella nanjingensis]|uniref:DUF4082 domain-containing protein n=1 Tax=Cohnella nanjingensis TaxID=1387779 RepID=A0A7X0RNV8_9BACL|nr:glycoside hydrolase family 2 TIM barrel-domain containing protein [Cohnella nanjingensis]MBB6670806.1 DUF4082 domain-containing protein [Cohnella nanjingensis]
MLLIIVAASVWLARHYGKGEDRMENLFADRELDNRQSEAGPLELGQVYQADVPGTIAAIRVYALPDETGNRTARIWRNHDSALIGGPYIIPNKGKAGWITYRLPQPVEIAERTDYTVAVSAGEVGKTYPTAQNPEAGSNGKHLSFPAHSGRVTSLAGARPVNTPDDGSVFMVDIEFVPGSMQKSLDVQNLQSLDGSWRIVQDTENIGESGQWFMKDKYPTAKAVSIQVPGNISEAFPGYNGTTWYSRTFRTSMTLQQDMKYYLRFGAIQYKCEIWLNGTSLGTHEGTDTAFELEATRALVRGDNFLAIRVENPPGSGMLPNVFSDGGIVDHAALVAQPLVRITEVFAVPDIGTGEIALQIGMENNTGAPADVALTALYGEFKGSDLGQEKSATSIPAGKSVQNMKLVVPSPHLWSPDDPFLYRIAVTAEADGKRDAYDITHFGFRDFRIVDGYFYLNNKRIYVKSVHGTARWDPIVTQGTPRDMSIMNKQYKMLKDAGFNMLRTLQSASLPEQLDLADELGLMIYEEHEGSWNLPDPAKFSQEITGNLLRDRNHPSIVIWGLLNENKANYVFDAAKDFLTDLRKLDPTRLVLLGSGRWDKDLKTGSASNPGSLEWNVYLGGEDKDKSELTGYLPEEIGAFIDGAGDIHVYNNFPTSWNFLTAFAKLGERTKNMFLSEAGAGSIYNAVLEEQKAIQANALTNLGIYTFARERSAALNETWKKYGLDDTYPNIEDAMIDSEMSEASERALLLSAIRSNPKINGHSLTSLFNGASGEGIMDNFRGWKAGHENMLKEAWAKLKWNLFVNPTSVYADAKFHVKVSLANEDVLTEGKYPTKLSIKDSSGKDVWKERVVVGIKGGPNPPFAYGVYDADLMVPGLTEGKYTLTAVLEGIPNASASTYDFNVFSRSRHPGRLGLITVLGTSKEVNDLLLGGGAVLHEYDANEEIGQEAVIVGDLVTGDAALWRSIYKKAAKGAHVVFLSDKVFKSKNNAYKWLAVPEKGSPAYNPSWLYHQESIAKADPIMSGLPAKLLTPGVYRNLLSSLHFIKGGTVPEQTTAVAIYNTYGAPYSDGILTGTYNHHAGKFTVTTFNLTGNIGDPAADRMLLNMAAFAKSNASDTVVALPADYEAELDRLGIKND